MTENSATIIAAYSRRMRLRLEDGEFVEARVKGKTLSPVCGDRVSARSLPDEADWLITAIEPRRNALTRPNRRGAAEVLAANVDILLVVAAPTPQPDWFVIDRYLCAAELMRAEAIVVSNKSDLAAAGDLEPALSVYADAGYEILRTSTATGEGLRGISAAIGERTALVVGQSGVGKSSIINEISNISRQKIAGISPKSGEGRHTTVASVLLPLDTGGGVIDSPGVRDYAPAFTSATDVEAGFREIHSAAANCRFANCLHLREPGCAVKAAVDAGTIDARRYESYRRAVRLAERLSSRSG